MASSTACCVSGDSEDGAEEVADANLPRGVEVNVRTEERVL
jgi:hypothetical protein